MANYDTTKMRKMEQIEQIPTCSLFYQISSWESLRLMSCYQETYIADKTFACYYRTKTLHVQDLCFNL